MDYSIIILLTAVLTCIVNAVIGIIMEAVEPEQLSPYTKVLKSIDCYSNERLRKLIFEAESELQDRQFRKEAM